MHALIINLKIQIPLGGARSCSTQLGEFDGRFGGRFGGRTLQTGMNESLLGSSGHVNPRSYLWVTVIQECAAPRQQKDPTRWRNCQPINADPAGPTANPAINDGEFKPSHPAGRLPSSNCHMHRCTAIADRCTPYHECTSLFLLTSF